MAAKKTPAKPKETQQAPAKQESKTKEDRGSGRKTTENAKTPQKQVQFRIVDH